MLTKLRFKNFLSFKEDTVIDLNATGYKVLSDHNVYNNTLKGALFVGANASGKTNIIRAIKVLLDLLFAEKLLSLRTYKCLFSKENFIELEYDFKVLDQNINYLIKYDIIKNNVIEQLKINNDLILNRIGSSGQSEITESRTYSDIDPNSLLLREIYFNTKFRNSKILKAWFEFLLVSVYLDGYREFVFSPGKHSLDINDYLDKEGADSINNFFNDYKFNQRIEYSKSSNGTFTKIESLQKEKDIFFKREGVGEPIPFIMESLGNQKLLRFLPSFFHVVKNGGMLVIDEFSGFHNFLEELLIRFFMRNSKSSQLFLVSHSTNLLSNALLRPDQLYSVDFFGVNGSKIKRFSSEQPRAAQNIEKMYTSGIFGGVPNFGNDKN